MAFENDPIRGLLLGLGLAVTITTVVELVRYRRRARRPRQAMSPEAVRASQG